MQAAELLAQADQLMLIAFVLPTQDLPQQSRRARFRPITLHTRLTQPARERRLDHQQPRRMRKPRTIP